MLPAIVLLLGAILVPVAYSACDPTCAEGEFCDTGDTCTACLIPNCKNCGANDEWDGSNTGSTCPCASTCPEKKWCGMGGEGATCISCSIDKCKDCGDRDIYDGSNTGSTCKCASTCPEEKYCGMGPEDSKCNSCTIENCKDCGDKDIYDGSNTGSTCECETECSSSEWCGMGAEDSECKACGAGCVTCGEKRTWDGANDGGTCTECGGTSCLNEGSCEDIASEVTKCIGSEGTTCILIEETLCRSEELACVDMNTQKQCQDSISKGCVSIEEKGISEKCAICETESECTKCLKFHCLEDTVCTDISTDFTMCINPDDQTCQLLGSEYVRGTEDLGCMAKGDLHKRCLEGKEVEGVSICTFCSDTFCPNEAGDACMNIADNVIMCRDSSERTCKNVGSELCRVNRTVECKHMGRESMCRDMDDKNVCHDSSLMPNCQNCPGGDSCDECRGVNCLKGDGTCMDISEDNSQCINKQSHTACTPLLLKYCRTQDHVCMDMGEKSFCQDSESNTCVSISATPGLPLSCAVCATSPDPLCVRCLENNCLLDKETDECKEFKEDLTYCMTEEFKCEELDGGPGTDKWVRDKDSLECIARDGLSNKCLEAQEIEGEEGYKCTFCKDTHCATEAGDCDDIKNQDDLCKNTTGRTCTGVGDIFCKEDHTAECKRLVEGVFCRDESDKNKCYDSTDMPNCMACEGGTACDKCLTKYCFETTPGSDCKSIITDITKCINPADGLCGEKTSANCRDSTSYACVDFSATSTDCQLCTDGGEGYVCDKCDNNFCLKEDASGVCEDITEDNLKCGAPETNLCSVKGDDQCRDVTTKECFSIAGSGVQKYCEQCQYSVENGYQCTKCDPLRCFSQSECVDITLNDNKCIKVDDWTCTPRDTANVCRNEDTKHCYTYDRTYDNEEEPNTPDDIPIVDCVECRITAAETPNVCLKCNVGFCMTAEGSCHGLAGDVSQCREADGSCAPNTPTRCRDFASLGCVDTATYNLPENCEVCVKHLTEDSYTCPKCSIPHCLTTENICLNILTDGEKCVDPNTHQCTPRDLRTVCRDSVTLICREDIDIPVDFHCELCTVDGETPENNKCEKCSDNYCLVGEGGDGVEGSCKHILDKDTLTCADPTTHLCKSKESTQCRDSLSKKCLVSGDIGISEFCSECERDAESTYKCTFCDYKHCLPVSGVCENIESDQSQCVLSETGACGFTDPSVCRDDVTYRCVDSAKLVFKSCDVAHNQGSGLYSCEFCNEGYCLSDIGECLYILSEPTKCANYSDKTKCVEVTPSLGRDHLNFKCMDGSDETISSPTFTNCDLAEIVSPSTKYTCKSCQKDACYNKITKDCPLLADEGDMCTMEKGDCREMSLWDGVCRDTLGSQHWCIAEEKNFLLKCHSCGILGGELYYCSKCFDGQCLNENGDCLPLGSGYCTQAGKCKLISVEEKICRSSTDDTCISYAAESYTNCLECTVGGGGVDCDLCQDGFCVQGGQCMYMEGNALCRNPLGEVACLSVSHSQCRDKRSGICRDYSGVGAMGNCETCIDDHSTGVLKCTGCSGDLCLNLTTGGCEDISALTGVCRAGSICIHVSQEEHILRDRDNYTCISQGTSFSNCLVLGDDKCTKCEDGYELTGEFGCLSTQDVLQVPNLPSQEEDLDILKVSYDQASTLTRAHLAALLIAIFALGG